jgi:hemerythrin-like metal-binding protein
MPYLPISCDKHFFIKVRKKVIKWYDKLSVGIQEIDEQHMAFIQLLNELLTAMNEGKSKEIKGKILDNLVEYAFYHFTKEERLMKQYNYPYLAEHKKEHEEFVNKLIEFRKAFLENSLCLTSEMVNFMNKWWLTHIRISDKKYEPYLLNKLET